MLELRPYQTECLAALKDYWQAGGEHPLAVLATGTGKSLVQARLCKDFIDEHPALRILSITHVKELIEQNYLELLGEWPFAPAGIYSAGLGRRDSQSQILFCGIQSVHNKAKRIGHVDLLMVDECFPAGTLVNTPTGKKFIEALNCGDEVFNASGIGLIQAVSKRDADELLELELDDGRRVSCTPSHKFLTCDGWQEARGLEGSWIVGVEDMPALWKELHATREEVRWVIPSSERVSLEKATILRNLVLEIRRECDVDSGCEGKDDSDIEGYWTQTNRSGWKRESDSAACGSHDGVFRSGLGVGVCGSDENASPKDRLPDLLQGGHSESDANDCDRSRRRESFSTVATGTRSEEGRISFGSRVVRVSRAKQGSSTPVFNLQVSGHPSYFVEGLLAHNCHLIPKTADTMYGRFIQDLLAINPDMRIVGFTATPYRTDSGRLDEGDERLFTEVVYDYGIANGIRDGYLSPLVSKATDTGFDMSGVARRGGDYVPGALNAAVDKTATTQAAVSEIVTAGATRKSWLVFCAGVAHAEHVRDEIRSHNITCEMITGDTPSHERARFLRDFKSGKIRALTNNSVLTTGLNVPRIDLIADLRPTLSCVLYVQIAGRGTRPMYAKGMPIDTVEQRLEAIAAGPKPNCLYMDFSGNVSKRHGPVDTAEPRKPGDGNGEAPCKECEHCRELVHISAKVCPACGEAFPINEKPKHAATAAAAPILSTEPPRWLRVQSRKFYYHENAEGSESVRVDFLANFVSYKMWLSVRKARSRTDKFWRDHAGQEPYPADVDEWLGRIGELRETAEIQVRPKGKYWEIVGIKSAAQHAPPEPIVPDAVRRVKILEEEIPF